MKIRSSKLQRVSAATNTKYDTKLIAKWLKAKFDDEAFGTAYTMHRISDADAYMGRNKLTYNRKNNTIELIGNTPEEDIPIYKVIPQYSSTKKQGTYAPKLPKLVPIDEYNASHGITSATQVKATDWNPHLVKLSSKDAEYAMKNLDKTTAYLDDLDLKQYRTEFQPGTPGYMWSSKAGLDLLDKAGIKYELISKSIDASLNVPTKSVKSAKRVVGKYVKANDDEPEDDYDWWNDLDGYLLTSDDKFKQLMYDCRKKYGMPTDIEDDPAAEQMGNLIFNYAKKWLSKWNITADDDEIWEFTWNRMLEDWLLNENITYFWDDYKE